MPHTQEVSPEYIAKIKDCRDGLQAESQRLGKDLAKRLSKAFYKMQYSPVFKDARIVLNESTLLRATVSFWEDILQDG